ncbi:ATP-binding cassette domain-containing protein [Paenibacillus sepulcri]|uniref:ATP-binding cassette domain-containing protein n=1 Tax=Paenibacillus sepulcri TaxID=359917 RepID=UPI001AE3C9CB
MNEQLKNGYFKLSGIKVSGDPEAEGSSARLEQIDLLLAPGEWLNLVGVNGSGKTTLARLLAGLTMEGVYGEMDRGFAGFGPSPYVMQHPDAQLFGENPREEVSFALEWRGVPADEIPDRSERILSWTGLLPIADWPWEQLSGGQRQLAAVAASGAAETPLLVFDEATSMLDDASRGRVQQVAGRLCRSGTAVVWVTQRLNELDPYSRVVALAGGKIVYDGAGRQFLLGDGLGGKGQTPCEQCGLRLPYLASLAIEMNRLGKLDPHSPLPVTAEEWREVLKRP